MALAAALVVTSLVDTGFGSWPHPLGSLLGRAETVLVVRMASHTETNAVFEVAQVLRGDATLQKLSLSHTRAGRELPKKTRGLLLFSQGDNHWGPPKDSFQVGQPVKGQASYRGWILLDGPGESKEELKRLKQLVEQNPYKPDLHGKLSARILLPAQIKPGDGARPAAFVLTNSGEGPVRVLTRCHAATSTFTGWLSVCFRPQSEQHTPSIEELAKSVVELAPGQSTTLPFEFTDPGEEMPQVTADYQVSEELAEKLNVWFGRVEAARIVFIRTDSGVLRVVPPEQLPLCGSRLSIEEAVKQEFAFVVACETLDFVMREANLGRSNWIQEFWPLELLAGNDPGICILQLEYKFYDGANRRERGIGKGERVIWIVRRSPYSIRSWDGTKVLVDTPQNRAAVLAALAKEQSKRAATPEAFKEATLRGRIFHLNQTAKSPDPRSRWQAIDALANLGSDAKEAVPDLVRRLKDEDARVRRTAAIAFNQILPPSVNTAIANEEAAKAAEVAVPALIEALSDESAYVRQYAALSLGACGSHAQDVVGPLIGLLGDASEPVRMRAATALGRIGPDAKEAVPKLIACFKMYQGYDVRTPAVHALGKIGPAAKEAVPFLIELLQDPRDRRYPAAQALGGIGPEAKAAVPALIAALEDPESLVRAFAAEALGKIAADTELTVPALMRAQKDEDSLVRTYAERALRKLRAEYGPKVGRGLPRERIVPAEEDGKAAPPECGARGTAQLTPAQRRIADEVVGDVIARIQARIAQKHRLTESIAELAKREKSQLGGTSAGDVAICAYSCRQSRVPVPEALNEKVVDDIIFQYRNPPEGSFSDTYSHQKACVWALGELGHCKAVPVIMECLADEEKPYGAAWDALRHVSDEALIPVIARQMDIKPQLSAYPATGGLCRLGRPALPLLRRILEAPDPQGKEGAIGALVVICLPECLPPLERLAESGELKGDSARRKLAAAIATIRCRAVDKTYVPPKWSYEDRCRMHHLVALALSIEHQVKGSEDLADEAEAALIEIGPSMAAAAVRPQLSSRTHTDVGGGGDYWVSRKAAELMARFGEPAIPALLDALNDDFDTARGNASRALKRITGQDFGTDYAAWRARCLSAGKLNPAPSTDVAKLPQENIGDPNSSHAAADALKQALPETETGGGKPWLQFRSTEKDLGKIVASRCVFVFPKDVEVFDNPYFAMKDGYLFEAKEALYVTDSAGKLVVEHKLPQASARGSSHWGNDWFGYTDFSAGWSAGRLRVFHANGKEIGTVAVPDLCMAVVSRDGSRVFFLRTKDPDGFGLQGPIVADVRTGKVLKVHRLDFRSAMPGDYIGPTKDGLIATNLSSSPGLIRFNSEGEIAWQSPLAGFRYGGEAPTSGQYVLAVNRDRETKPSGLKVLDGKGQVVLEKWPVPTGCVRLLPDDERLLLACDEGNQRVRQLYRLKDGSRLWSVPHPLAHAGEFDYACLSPDGARLASFIRQSPGNNRAIDKDGRDTFMIAVLDLTTGAELLRQELPFREKPAHYRQPRWTDAKTIELISGDYLYRIRLKF
ncbi:MAG TPA: HEAT repeat domain-containing protein [Thermoguttaceae bacterium]|nr:HEAT repeat domain-containing protein [Thermoguttaceae bacterium]